MTREQVTAFFERRRTHWEHGDAAALSATHANDGVIQSPVFGTVRGKDAIEASYRDLFRVFSHWSFDTEDLLIDGDHVAQFFNSHATHSSELFGVAATGRRFEVHGVLYFEFKNGQIQRERRLYDFTSLLLQVGVLKAKPGHP